MSAAIECINNAVRPGTNAILLAPTVRMPLPALKDATAAAVMIYYVDTARLIWRSDLATGQQGRGKTAGERC
jgi:hypothetical protein